MTSVCRSFCFACAMAFSSGLLGVPAANAITWDFGPLAPGALGTTHAYTVDGVTLTAAGFSAPAALNGAANVGLFGKNVGGDETGLGLQNDPDNEISGTSLVQIAMAAGLTNVMFTMESTTAPDAWEVFGSNSATDLGASLLVGNDEGVAHSVPFFDFYNFTATDGNVLLGTMSAVAVPGPVVGAGLPGLIAALGGLVAMARRRRKELA